MRDSRAKCMSLGGSAKTIPAVHERIPLSVVLMQQVGRFL